RDRHGDRRAPERPARGLQRHLAFPAVRLIRAQGIGGGGSAGLVAGALWWLAEAMANHATGGFVPLRVGGMLAAIDVAIGGVAGLIVGLLLPLAGRRPTGTALAL